MSLQDIVVVDINSLTVDLVQKELRTECNKQPPFVRIIPPERHKFDRSVPTPAPRAHSVMGTKRDGKAPDTHRPLYSAVARLGPSPESGQPTTKGDHSRQPPTHNTRGRTQLEQFSALGSMGSSARVQTAWTEDPSTTITSRSISASGGQVNITPVKPRGRKKKADREVEKCCICMDVPTQPTALGCKHVFCKECIDGWFKQKPTCPSCGKVYGELKGSQPQGKMSYKTKSTPLPGYPKAATIEITYSFPSGKQGVGLIHGYVDTTNIGGRD